MKLHAPTALSPPEEPPVLIWYETIVSRSWSGRCGGEAKICAPFQKYDHMSTPIPSRLNRVQSFWLQHSYSSCVILFLTRGQPLFLLETSYQSQGPTGIRRALLMMTLGFKMHETISGQQGARGPSYFRNLVNGLISRTKTKMQFYKRKNIEKLEGKKTWHASDWRCSIHETNRLPLLPATEANKQPVSAPRLSLGWLPMSSSPIGWHDLTILFILLWSIFDWVYFKFF